MSAWPAAVYLLPEIFLAGGALLILLCGAAFPRRNMASLSLAALVALTAALFALIFRPHVDPVAGLLSGGGWGILFRIIVIFAASTVVFLSHDYVRDAGMPAAEYYVLVLTATIGMMITAASAHFLMLFLGVELMSLSFVLLAALKPGDARSKEAALKYLMYSLVASAFLLFGLAVVYALWGSWDMALVGQRAAAGDVSAAAGLALIFLAAGLAFKIGLVPCHMWIPDVYDGAPATVAAFLSVGPKAASLAAAATIFTKVFGPQGDIWEPVLIFMSVASMLWGNLAALAQRSLKRMMAYSSIAHVGYLAMAVLAAARDPLEGLGSLGFYLFTYTFFNIGFFALLVWGEGKDGRGPYLKDVGGLGRRQPLAGAALALFLLALAGIPPTAGFMAKFWIFLAAVRADMVGLAVIGVLASVVGAVYYLRVLYYLYLKESPAENAVSLGLNVGFYSLVLAALATVWFGLWPSPLLELVRRASLP